MPFTTSSGVNTLSRSRSDRILLWSLRGAAAIAGAIVLFIVSFVAWEALPALRNIGVLRFATDASWHPTEGQYNLLPMLMGTMLVTCGAIIIATPLGILSAIFCTHYAPPLLATPYRRLIELLAGIPSVVYGFWGLVVLVPLIARVQPPGASLLAGIIILGLMILPTITLMTDAAIVSVPREYHQGAAALGFARWATLRRVILPAARPGILTGVFLGIARAIGETMAVLMVCGNVVNTPTGLFEPMRALTANIALEMAYAMDNHRAALFVSGLVLIMMIIILVSAAEITSQERTHA